MKLLLTLLGLLVAMALQGQLADRVASPGLRPDLLLTVILTVAVAAPGRTLAAAGLLGGIAEGVLCGMYLGAFVISRLVAALAAWTIAEPLNVTPVVAMLIGAVGAAVAQVVFLLVQPTADLGWWLGVTIRQSLLTGALTGALAPLASRTLRGSAGEDD